MDNHLSEDNFPFPSINASSTSRTFSVSRKKSTRARKSFKPKNSKLGLVINTNVSRHAASKPPQEIKPLERSIPSNNSSQPPSYQATVANATSRFPSAYIPVSRRDTLRASTLPPELYFAPPPTNKRTSYKRFAKPRSRRPSDVTTFEEDDTALQPRSRSDSRATLFEENTDNGTILTLPDTANTTSSHRSRGWWNVITTPFESKSPYPSNSQQTPAVPLVPQQWSNALGHNGPSAATNDPSPADRDIPIMLGGEEEEGQHTENATEDVAARPSMTNFNTQTAQLSSPPSTNEEFSPSGLLSNRGRVNLVPNVVHAHVPRPYQAYADTLSSPEPSHETQLTSFRATINKTVRFLTPRSSGVRDNYAPSEDCKSLDFEEIELGDLKTPHDMSNSKKKKKKMSFRKKCCFCCVCFVIFGILFLVFIILLAVFLSRKHHSTSTITWTNTTSFPGVPVGPLIIARANLVDSQANCVVPNTVWSCAAPKEEQAALLPNNADQPNFVFDIVFDNSTKAPVTDKRARAITSFVRKLIKRSPTSSPVPSPPILAEQIFLGNTTDNNSQPFEGETTSFYISLIVPGSTPPQMPTVTKRSPQSSQSINSFPNLASNIPIPSLNPDGSPPAANLLPSSLPAYQPLRLYNRGMSNEHYGFYTYFDRSIFLKSNIMTDSTDIIPADQNGGSTQLGANVRCTWSDTRLLVQIWTNTNATSLLPRAASGSKISNGDFVQPGSFPYPVTVTMDRHGGSLSEKMLYCFGIEATGQLNTTARQFQPEDRAFGGTIVNPSEGPFANQSLTNGIDGGTGGCFCKWQNF